MNHLATQLSNPTVTNYPFGRLYENIVTNGGNVQFGDTYLLNDDTFRACSVEQQRSALLGALDCIGSGAKRAQLGLHEIGTESYSWIESTPLFPWLRSPEAPLFHILGKPASGKSTLMKYLTDSRRVRDKLDSNGRQWTIVHYFFDFRGGSTPANDPVGMVKLFVKQLMSINRVTESFLLRQENIERLRGSDLNVCIDVLTDAVRLNEHGICAFIDGLDEYDGSLWTSCSHLEVIRHRTGMKMCLASRPEPGILKACSSFPSLIMQDHNSETIRLHVQRRIGEISVFEPEIETLFTPPMCEKLVQKADGVILWARLALDGADIYEHILERIPPRLKQDAAPVLLLLERLFFVCSDEETFWQVIIFIKTQCGFTKFLGGSLDAKLMEKRLAIYLMNVVQYTPTDDSVPSSYDHISLIHLSLATYLRKVSWVEKHLNKDVRTIYGFITWESLLVRVTNAASLEHAINDTVIVDEIWKPAELTARKRQYIFKAFWSRSITDYGEYHLLMKDLDLNVCEARVRCILPSWLCCADLLDHAVQRLPHMLTCGSTYHIKNQDLLDSISNACMAWHLLICHECREPYRQSWLVINHMIRMKQCGDLGFVVAFVHENAAYIDKRLGTEHASLDLILSALSIAHAYRRVGKWPMPESVWHGLVAVILKHYDRLRPSLDESVDDSGSVDAFKNYEEATAASSRQDKMQQQEYDSSHSETFLQYL